MGGLASAPTSPKPMPSEGLNSESTKPSWCSSGRDPGRAFISGPSVRWDPLTCKLRNYSRADVSTCLQRLNVTRVLFAGDSLIREQFMQLQEIYRSGSTDSLGKSVEGQFNWTRPD